MANTESKAKRTAECALRLKNITKVYGEGENAVKALKGINLDFRKNEFVSILGPSGCGKTTMLNIIGGLDRYTEGDLVINGVSTKQYKDADWDAYRNDSVGFVFQSYNLIQHQSVLSNVEMALSLSGIGSAERKKRALEVLERVGLKDQANKRPNQLSGGQMQRVAIARALVNDPEIILADEPTGALDTETSIQVMDLLKEVANERLVIMVTHNPDLAEKYSTRIINLLDGEVTGDTDPYDGAAESDKNSASGTQKKRTSMSFVTALMLSLSNLRTKKGRTILTSIAGSIGIIGIALVLAVSTGFSAYINKLQADTLSVYPVTISEATIDLSDFEKLAESTGADKFPTVKKVYSGDRFGNLTNMLKSNKITEDYINFVNTFVDEENQKAAETDEKWKYCVQEGYGFDVNNYIWSEIGINLKADGEAQYSVMPIDALVRNLIKMFDAGMANSDLPIQAEFVREYIPTLCEIPEEQELIESQYDLLAGDWATEADELLLVVDTRNQIADITLALLGINSIENFGSDYSVNFGGKEEYTFEEIMQKEFYYLKNDDRYTKIPTAEQFAETVYKGENANTSPLLPELPKEKVTTLKIKGIVRRRADVDQGVLDTGIAYTSAFVKKILEDNKDSEIVSYAREHDGSAEVRGRSDVTNPKVRELAGNDTPNKLSLYSVGYEAKEKLKDYLDTWNDRYDEMSEDRVVYSDSTEMLFAALNSMVDAVKIVLICFTGISLVVSSIMIGIITYVSVVERTKEIGVLRSIGARKRDISNIFNAETFLIGLFAGLLGVAITYLLTIPINLIVGIFITNVGSLASLKITDALILVAVSFILTLIAGLIPARIAAKKDPVVALRTE